MWGSLASTVSNVLTASEIVDGPAGLAANLAFGWGAQKIIDTVVGDRLGDSLVDAVRVDQIRKAMSIEVSTVAAVAQATYEHLVANGALPAAVPPPPNPTGEQLMTMTENCYRAEVVSWRDSLPDAYKRIADEVVVNALAEATGFNSRMALGEHVNGKSPVEAHAQECDQKTSAGS